MHKIENGPATQVKVTKEEGMEMLKQMQMIRRLETMAGNLYKEKLVRGFCHLYTGQVNVYYPITHSPRIHV